MILSTCLRLQPRLVLRYNYTKKCQRKLQGQRAQYSVTAIPEIVSNTTAYSIPVPPRSDINTKRQLQRTNGDSITACVHDKYNCVEVDCSTCYKFDRHATMFDWHCDAKFDARQFL